MSTSFHIGATPFEAPGLAPALYLVATPIGNLGDVTIRALQTLAACDVIYCEDTRVTLKLLERYGLRKPLKPYHDHNAARAGADILAVLHEGKSVALVSDAGTPLISDPGYRLVVDCQKQDLAVTSVPGASAMTTALQLSGLPSDRFAFMGFLPEKKSQREKLLQSVKGMAMTQVFYESPHRIVDALADVAAALGDRQVAVARELTKLHEEILRGTAAGIHAVLSARDAVKGEIVLVIAPAPDHQPADENEIEDAITATLQEMSASKAAATLAKQFNLPRDEIYARILKRKDHGQA